MADPKNESVEIEVPEPVMIKNPDPVPQKEASPEVEAPLYSFGIHRMADGRWVVTADGKEVNTELLTGLVKDIHEHLQHVKLVEDVTARIRRALGGQ